MITRKQVEVLCGESSWARVTAILTREFTPRGLNYELPKGHLYRLSFSPRWSSGILLISGKDLGFTVPLDAAELLE